MPSPPPPKPASRSGAGAFTLLAVLAFLALAAFLLMRREPAEPSLPPVAEASPRPAASPSAVDASPLAEFPLPDASPGMADASPAASPEPEPAAAGGTRPRRRPPASPAPAPRLAEARGTSSRLPAAPPPAPPSGRRFVLGTTVVESAKGVPRNLPGFDAAGVGVKRAPEVSGRVVLEMDPPQVRPGVDYTVKVYLVNDGDKAIPVQAVSVTTVEDGKTVARNPRPGARSVKPRQRALVHEFSGVWREAARSWAMEVTVTSERQDFYRNRLSWE